jgi:hypothetical protein
MNAFHICTPGEQYVSHACLFFTLYRGCPTSLFRFIHLCSLINAA